MISQRPLFGRAGGCAWLLGMGLVLGGGPGRVEGELPGALSTNLVISEFLYYPPVPSAEELAAGYDNQNDFEFVELLNISQEAIELGGVEFTAGISFTFPAAQLGPGERIVIVRDQEAFQARYGTGIRIGGEYSGRLANEGERLLLTDASGIPLRDFAYGIAPPWPTIPALGPGGFSLELIAPESNPNHADPASWRRSFSPRGTPGRSPDADGDGLWDGWELEHFGSLNPLPGEDPDEDGLANLAEQTAGTDPNEPDTDGDGLRDGIESNTGLYVDTSNTGTDPVRWDTDNDGLSDGVETNTGTFESLLDTGTSPLLWDTDADGFGDKLELDLGKDPLDPDSFPVPPNIVSFAADPEVVKPGESTTLTWLVEDADLLWIDQGVGEVTNPSGSLTHTPSPVGPSSPANSLPAPEGPEPASASVGATGLDAELGAGGIGPVVYTLTASNAYRTLRQSVTVTVVPAEPPRVDVFTVQPGIVESGGLATFSWAASGVVDAVRIDPGIGAVSGNSVTNRLWFAEQVLPKGSAWRYLDDGSDQGLAWSEPAFEDSGWKQGIGPLGYGNAFDATVIGFGPDPDNRFVTTYFRRGFVLTNVAQFRAATVQLMRDDGAQVYLNGVEIVRDNLPPGPVDFQTWASSAAPDDGQGYMEFPVDPTLLREGTNVLAVGIHNFGVRNPDLRFDLGFAVEGYSTNSIVFTLTASNGTGTDTAQTTVAVVQTATELVSFHHVWKYDESGRDLGTAWREPGFDDSAWPTGTGVFGVEQVGPAVPLIRTPLKLPAFGGAITVYFRTRFQLPVDPARLSALRLLHLVDDGAVVYLNGAEVHRLRVVPGQDYQTLADPWVGNAEFEGPFELPLSALLPGENLLAVELHQPYFSTTDAIWGARLEAVIPFQEPLEIALQPQSWTVPEGEAVSFESLGLGEQPLAYQWRRDGLTLPGATGRRLEVSPALPGQAGFYDVVITNFHGSITSAPARLIVLPDLVPPTLLSAVMGTNTDRLVVIFSEPVEPASATNLGHYEIRGEGDQLLPILEVIAFNGASLTFRTAPLVPGPLYRLHAQDILDRSANANSMPPTQVYLQYQVVLVPIDGVWLYDESGANLGDAWPMPGYDDLFWPRGPGLLGFEDSRLLPVPLLTQLTPPEFRGPVYYFRTWFDFPGDPTNANLRLRHVVDDGAVVFLNGTEIHRFNVPPGQTYQTLATQAVPDAVFQGPFSVASGAMVNGANVLAAEAHQVSAISADVVWGAELVQVFPPPAAIGHPLLQINRVDGLLMLRWNEPGFVLETARAPSGPWEPAAGPTTRPVIVPSDRTRFYRLRWLSEEDPPLEQE